MGSGLRIDQKQRREPLRQESRGRRYVGLNVWTALIPPVWGADDPCTLPSGNYTSTGQVVPHVTVGDTLSVNNGQYFSGTTIGNNGTQVVHVGRFSVNAVVQNGLVVVGYCLWDKNSEWRKEPYRTW